MRNIFVVLAITVLCGTISGREWTDAKSRHKIDADFVEAKVTFRLPNGQTKVVDMRSLSADDRQFILKELENATKPEQASHQLNNLIADLESALASSDKVGVEAATKAICEIDPSNDALKKRVETLSKQPQIESAMWVLGQAGTSNAWVIDSLLSIERRLSNAKYGVQTERAYGLSPHVNEDDFIREFVRLQSRRDLIRLISERNADDQRVKDLFEERRRQLRSDPQPDDRALAAFWLSGADSSAAVIVPELIESAKSDAAPRVRIAALVAIGGFGSHAKSAIPLIADTYESTKEGGEQLNLLLSAALIQSDSPQLKKLVIKVCENYKRNREASDERIRWMCKALQLMEQKCSWAIPQFLEAAETSVERRRRDGTFEYVTSALQKIGGGDARVLRFYERTAKEGPADFRVQSDTAAKELRIRAKP